MDEFLESPEQLESRRSVLDWWKNDCGWGRKTPELPAIELSDTPGIDKIHTEVARKPSSTGPGYAINAAGKKSHHITTETHVCKWEGCKAVLSGNWLRCPEHVRLWRRDYKVRKVAK